LSVVVVVSVIGSATADKVVVPPPADGVGCGCSVPHGGTGVVVLWVVKFVGCGFLRAGTGVVPANPVRL